MNILIVDNNPQKVQDLVNILFNLNERNITWLTDPDEAINAIELSSKLSIFDLLILDYTYAEGRDGNYVKGTGSYMIDELKDLGVYIPTAIYSRVYVPPLDYDILQILTYAPTVSLEDSVKEALSKIK